MKTRILIAVIVVAATLAWQAAAQYVAKQTTGGYVGVADNPLRMSGGQVMDFSPAIRWYQSNPQFTQPRGIAYDSPLLQEMERRKKAHEVEGQRWSRYLISGGSIGGRLDEGVVITGIRVTKVVQDGYMPAGPRQSTPRYRTISTTKEVLLKNAPANFSLPIFAFPVGQKNIGTALLDAFDYGTPVAYAAPATQPRARNAATNTGTSGQSTNAASIAAEKAATAAAMLKAEQRLAETGDDYGLYRMGERYLKGDGVPKDLAKARELFTKASAAGSPAATEALSRLNQASTNSPATPP